MNTRQKNLAVITSLLVFWGIFLLAGYLLLAPSPKGAGSGSGNGNGNGNGSGSGGTSTQDLGGQGNSPQDQGGTGAGEQDHPDTSPDPQTNATEGTEQGTEELPPSAEEQAAMENAKKKLEQGEKDLIPTLQGEEQEAPPATEQSKTLSAAEAKKGFFGLEVSGKGRAIFLLDISGSMASSTSEGSSRLELLKKVFCNTMDKLHNETKNTHLLSETGSFMVVAFSDGTEFFPPNRNFLRYATPNDINAAKNFVMGFNSCGGTDIMGAWQEMAQVIRGGNVNVVYFLSDGDPSVCDVDNEKIRILTWLGQNFPGLVINTISLGKNSDLLQNIAQQHRGLYREIY